MASKEEAERRAQLIACAEAVGRLAGQQDIKPVHVSAVADDLEIRRVLDTIVRRWTRLEPTRYLSAAAANTPSAKLHREHVVPCRVLVDRMIMNPTECRALLASAVVIAAVTEAEHQRLGGIFRHHHALYGRMLTASVAKLPELGRERYAASRIALQSA